MQVLPTSEVFLFWLLSLTWQTNLWNPSFPAGSGKPWDTNVMSHRDLNYGQFKEQARKSLFLLANHSRQYFPVYEVTGLILLLLLILTGVFLPEQTWSQRCQYIRNRAVQVGRKCRQRTPQSKITSVICQCSWKKCLIHSLHWVSQSCYDHYHGTGGMDAILSASCCTLLYPGETILSWDEQYLQKQVLNYDRSSFHSCSFVG